MVVPPELQAAKGRNNKAREVVKGLQKHSAVLSTARGEIDRAFRDTSRERAACIEETALSELRRFCGEEAGDIAKQVKRISESGARVKVYGLALTLADEATLEANIKLTLAQADLKASAAELIDAERFARVGRASRRHGSTRGGSEGEVEIRSKRFEEEGRLGDQLRSDARTLRETASRLQTIYNALRTARGK